MTTINIDLYDYEDEVKETFCNNNCILKQYAPAFFKDEFISYVTDLEKNVLVFNNAFNSEKVLNDLINFKKMLER